MKKLLVLVVSALVGLGAMAQSNGGYDYIFLNNGTVIQGTIVGDASGLTVTIQTVGGEFLTYPKTEINKISHENPAAKLPEGKQGYVKYTEYDRGFWCGVDLYGGISTNIGDNSKNGELCELDVVGGYRLNEYLRFGIGFGARYYFQNSNIRHGGMEWSFPIFANVRGNLISDYERRVTPYYSFSIGGAIQDGVMVRPTIGLRISDLKRSAFMLGVSYLGQSLARPDGKDKFQSFVALNVGYEF